jgi:hypothetical protein
MDTTILFGWVVAALGTLFGIIGAIYTTADNDRQRRIGYTCWCINSPCLVISLVGTSFGWFEPLSVFILAPLNLFYWFTAYRGLKNNTAKKEAVVNEYQGA